MTAVNYRDLTLYKKARELVIGVDQLIDGFPKKRQAWVIAEQMFDAATSIGANIAEGKAKYFGREYLRYLSHSQGSANEVDHWLHTTLDCHLAPADRIQLLINLNIEILKMLSAARATLAQQLENNAGHTLKEMSTSYDVLEPEWRDPLEVFSNP